MHARTVRILCLAMAAIVPSAVMSGEAKAAMALASGVAALNGASLSRSAAIFAGDQLETSSNSAITINANGSTVLIGANSRVHYFGDSFALHSGSMQVNTSKGLKLQTDTVTIEPNKGAAKFRVDRASKTVMIAALTGEVRVNNGEETAVVPPGGSLTLKEKDDDGPESAVRRTSDKAIFYIVAAGAGGAAAMIFATKNEKKPISNQIP
jgi:FecR protein